MRGEAGCMPCVPFFSATRIELLVSSTLSAAQAVALRDALLNYFHFTSSEHFCTAAAATSAKDEEEI
jgi:hypothetical protein